MQEEQCREEEEPLQEPLLLREAAVMQPLLHSAVYQLEVSRRPWAFRVCC